MQYGDGLLAWSSWGQIKAWSGFRHVFGPSPGGMVIINIANLACEGQVPVVVLHKVVSDPAQAVQRILCLASVVVALHGTHLVNSSQPCPAGVVVISTSCCHMKCTAAVS